jgi:hypothetical protein
MDKLNSQPDLFTYDQSFYNASVESFNQRMTDNMKWVCTNLLLDPFEYCTLIHVINQDKFDIINVRDMSRLGSHLKFEWLIMYIGLHLKIRMNGQWRTQEGF